MGKIDANSNPKKPWDIKTIILLLWKIHTKISDIKNKE